MFVLPPPPRYPTQAAYNAAVASGQAQPLIETNNILTHPTGPEYQLLAAEGTYLLKEDIHLATPPPHPSEAPIINPNPLATAPQPPTAGTKLSLLAFKDRPSPVFLYKSLSGSSGKPGLHPSIKEHPNENRSSIDASSEGRTSMSGSAQPPLSQNSAPAFGEGNSLLLSPTGGKGGAKRGKPKNNIAKSNSSFISRVIVHEHLQKRLQDHVPAGIFAFANINRAFQWLDLSASNKQDHLIKILFTKGHCLCHDVNLITKGPTHIDLIMGFSTGEIIWYEPITQKYTRLNKNGIINTTAVSEIRWVPGSENLFLAGHMDGSLVVYDKEKEDATFIPEESSNGEVHAPVNYRERIEIKKSVHSRNQKVNPVAFWKLSNQRINAFAFSPDNTHVAVAQEDGSLRIVNYLKEELLDLYRSYFGGFGCVCWSPDGKYVLTGGQDDLVTIWSFHDRAIVARCAGHDSWVTGVAFDPWRCDEKNYRFGSVAEDCKLLLWDFNVGMLSRPKAGSVRARGNSVVSRFANPLARADTQNTSSSRLRSNSNLSTEPDDEIPIIKHEVESRLKVPTLPPVLKKVVDNEPLDWLTFNEESIITSCRSGHIRTWLRPSDNNAKEA